VFYERRIILKKLVLMLLAAMLVLGLAACGKKTETGTDTKTDVGNEEAKSTGEEALAIPAPDEAWEVIPTPYGDLRYPASLYEDLTRTEGTENDIYSRKFSTVVEGNTYDRFTLYIGGEVGDATYLGSLTGKDGSESEVYVLAHELGDLSGLDSQQQDKIYAMQEALNEVLGE
jgi:hypothetical protein